MKKVLLIILMTLVLSVPIVLVVINYLSKHGSSYASNIDISEIVLIKDENIDLNRNNIALQALNNLTFDVLKMYPNDKNILFSPLGVAANLSLLQNAGSQEVQDEITNFMINSKDVSLDAINQDFHDYINYISYSDPSSEILYGSSIWVNSSDNMLPDAFKTTAEKYFYSEIYSEDFSNKPDESLKKLNGWVNYKTKGKIEAVLNQVPPNFYCSLINTLYFEGKWDKRFSRNSTKLKDFHLQTGETIKVPMMFNRDNYKYYKDESMEILRCDYKDSNTGMYILLPTESSDTGQLISSIDSEWWNSTRSKLQSRKIILELPKFTFSTTTSLNDYLNKLGVQSIFNPGFEPLPEISKDLYVTSVSQNCFIQVDEEGTKAAAATKVNTATKSEPQEPIKFTADRPFIFIISDIEKGSILFIGRVSNPSS